MRYPQEWYQMHETIAERFPALRPAQQRGLALWVYGAILAGSACQHAVLTALTVVGSWHALRQLLREWLYDGADKAAPCTTQIEVAKCFAPLVRWLLSWWQGRELALALDATAHGDRLVALVLSVLYRGTAIPVAWALLPANQPRAWLPHLQALLQQVREAVPTTMRVVVLADRGLWSPTLWASLQGLRWHPLLRVQESITFRPHGQCRLPARSFVPGPGHAWVGAGVAFKDRQVRRSATLVVVWEMGQASPWMLLTDLPPHEVGVCWYGLRVWMELGFRALKGLGWQWQRTRRTDPERVARHWLVLAVATLWVVAYGTRVEDAFARDLPPARLQRPPTMRSARPQSVSKPRRVSVFALGCRWLQDRLRRGTLWRRLWLLPEPWPEPPSILKITYYDKVA